MPGPVVVAGAQQVEAEQGGDGGQLALLGTVVALQGVVEVGAR